MVQLLNFVKFYVSATETVPSVVRDFKQYTREQFCTKFQISSRDFRVLLVDVSTFEPRPSCTIVSFASIKGVIVPNALYLLYTGSGIEDFVLRFPARYAAAFDLESKSPIHCHPELLMLEAIMLDVTATLQGTFASATALAWRHLDSPSAALAQKTLSGCQQTLIQLISDCSQADLSLEALLDSDEDVALLCFLNQRVLREKDALNRVVYSNMQRIRRDRAEDNALLRSYRLGHGGASAAPAHAPAHGARLRAHAYAHEETRVTRHDLRSLPVSADEIADFVESFLFQLKAIEVESRELLDVIRQKGGMAELTLDLRRNSLLYFDLRLMYLELAFDLVTAVAGICGMNFYIPHGNIVWVWFATFCGCIAAVVLVYYGCLLLQHCMERKSMQDRMAVR